MNKLGSMDRTPITKSVSHLNIRQICQWTAATSLVAVGSVALFSASTLEKLGQNGQVSIDLAAFSKLTSTSLALGRVDEQKLLAEENRILEKSLFAQAETLPNAHTKFKKVRLARVAPVRHEQRLTAHEEKEISQLERVADPALESEAMASIYRRVRFKFLAAADRVVVPTGLNAVAVVETAPESVPATESLNSYPLDSIKIAQTAEALEFEEIPSFDASDFDIADEVSTSASVTAKPEVMEPAFKGETSTLQITSATSEPVALNIIQSPGLDLIPEVVEPSKMDTQAAIHVNSQKNEVKAATGPPEIPEVKKIAENKTLHAVGSASIDSAPESSVKGEALSATADMTIPKDYSADVASIYDMQPDPQSDEEAEYSNDAEYSARPVAKGSASSSYPIISHYGSGISKDEKGITIAWNEKSEQESKIFIGRPGESPPALKPEPTKTEFAKSLSKFSFNTAALQHTTKTESVVALVPESNEVSAPAEIDLNKCETARYGVEAFNPGAEKDSLSICFRSLSQEGERDGEQAKWWEAYGSEKEHWPTLALLRDSQLSNLNRVPMLSNASIRILSAISKTNTHTGTGILFGEIPSGLEIQLIGRSDSPIYLDGGMKERDSNSDTPGVRQFVFLNVQPGQPLLMVKDAQKNQSGTLPIVVKSGMATYVKVPELKLVDLNFVLLDASSTFEKRLAGLTGELVGQSEKIGISDTRGILKISKAVVLGDYPLYVDLLQSEKGYKNRYRVRTDARDAKTGLIPLYFFNELKVTSWIKQLAGGVSPFSGLIVGALPRELLMQKKSTPKAVKINRALRIGTLDKKSALVPERYVLSPSDQLEIKNSLTAVDNRFIGVQIPEGTAIPSLIDENGSLLWSEMVYAQPGVINVVGP